MDTFLIDKLIDVLNKETAIYDGILKISRDKTNIIVKGKVTDLESIIKLEQSMVLQMAKLEDTREELVGRLSTQLKLDPSEITITELVKLLHKEQGNRLKSCQEGLAKVLRELRDTNELNSKLIRNSLEYIDFSINLLADTASAGNLYGNSGQASDHRKKNFFDVKL